jgi:hypothetical protein
MSVMGSPRWHRQACTSNLSVGMAVCTATAEHHAPRVHVAPVGWPMETLCLTSSSSMPVDRGGG